MCENTATHLYSTLPQPRPPANQPTHTEKRYKKLFCAADEEKNFQELIMSLALPSSKTENDHDSA